MVLLVIRRIFSVEMIAAIVFFAVLAPIKPAHAYIDPGTGGMLLQLLLGGVAGALVIIKLYWYRFREAVARVIGRPDADNSDTD